jgi:hypothetical protein
MTCWRTARWPASTTRGRRRRLVLDRTTAVRIYRENGGTRGVLLVVKGDGTATHDEIIQPEA